MYRNSDATDDWKPSAKEWLSLLPGPDTKNTCGICKQCLSEYPLPKRRKLSELPPTVTCVEPLPANYDGLSKAAESGNWPLSGLHIVHAAAALDTTLNVTFPAKAEWGREDVGIENHVGYPGGKISVATKTVDQLVFGVAGSKEQPKVPTVLTIDTEGFDAFVLLGAARTLSSGGVAYLEFEYHSVKPWIKMQLKWVVDYLDNFHFDCYFAGNDGLSYKVTGGCWEDKYEFHKWSNVVCASRIKIEPHTCWHDALEIFSYGDGRFARSHSPADEQYEAETATEAATEVPAETWHSHANQNAAGSPRQFLGLKGSHSHGSSSDHGIQRGMSPDDTQHHRPNGPAPEAAPRRHGRTTI